MNSVRIIRTVVPVMAAATLSALPTPASAADVEPVAYAGNPSCAGLGYGHEIKFDPPVGGSLSADGVTVEMALGSDDHGTLVDWTASSPIDAVIVKGGPNANAYLYTGESSGDTGLHTPFNGPEKYYGLSHVNFCWDDKTPDTPDTPDTPETPETPETPDTPETPETPDTPDAPPADTPPAAQPPAVHPPENGGVLPAKVRSGRSRLLGPSGCAGRSVKALVKGRSIAKVVFRLDGRKVKTTKGAGGYKVRTAELGVGVHRIKAKVTYTRASGTEARTHVLTFQRCAARQVAPQFTG